MKLIKINQDHYVVVDDSEIQEGNWVLPIDNIPYQIKNKDDVLNFDKKITHSTKPLEIIKGIGENSSINYYYGTDRLSLQEVKELIGEVDVEKKAESYAKDALVLDTTYANGLFYGYIKGYNQALEDNKEKKYTEEDMRKAFDAARRCITMPIGGAKHQYYDEYSVSDFDEYKREILSAQTPTEWEVEIVDGKLKLKL